METYSVCFFKKDGNVVINYNKYEYLHDINWEKVRDKACKDSDCIGYGYSYGKKSNEHGEYTMLEKF